MVNNVTPVDTAAAVDLEMDLEVKSEPESDDDTFNCNVSETSSIEEVCKPEHPISDEELEEEPLIEMESVIVPQELVKDELEPNLLLFVKKEEPGPVKISTCSSAYFKRSTSKDDKCTQTDAVSELSVTKALRNVKRTRKNYSHSTSGQNVRKTNKKNNVKAAKTKTLSFKPLKADFEVELSLIRSRTNTKPNLCTKLAKNSLKLFRKKVEVTKNKLPKVISGVKLKSNFSKQINNELEENLANPVPSELQINKSFSKEVAEKETYKFFSDSKGKENTQCNNEDENTADTVFSSDNCELNDSNNGKSSENSKETSKPNSYDCTICGKQFREKSHLATHARAHNDTRNFKCNECGLLFKTKTNLYYHTKTHGAPFTCSKCNKTFIQKKMFTRHMRVVHSGEGLYNCDICGRSFKSAQNLELHYTLHTGNKPFSCNICRKSFVYKSTYRAHMKAHEADEQFNCEVCLAAGTQDKGELRRRCHHHSQARPWLCTVCGKGYPLKATLKNHMKSHDAEKPFKCEECGKCFVKRQTYESHVKTHSGQKPEYMCDQCSQSYYSFVSLKRHYMKHTGERNFVCDTCNKAFWTKDAMKVHRRSHENVKTFQCTQCSKAFAHKHTLVAHMRAHSGETLHSCDVCCKTFLHKYHLTRHLRQHSSTYPPLAASLYMFPPHSHMDMPTLQIL